MKLKNIIYLIAAATFSFLAVGCDNKEEEMKDPTFSFDVRVSEVGYNYARVSVKHNGPESVTWYGFVTDEVEKNSFDVFYEEYIRLIESGEMNLKRDTERNILIEDLEENKDYRYIAFGLKENGELYEKGGLGYIDFKTVNNIYLLNETEEWTIEYAGRSDNCKDELIKVKSNIGGLFAWNYVSKEVIDAFNEEYPDGYELWEDGIYMATVDGLKMFILEQISLIQYSVSLGDNIKDWTYTNTAENEPFEMNRLASGEYYIVAYGFKPDSQHTRTYSVLPLTIEEEEAKPEYSKWLGTYTFTGEAEVEQEDGGTMTETRTYDIQIKPYDNNFLYMVHGWECGESVEYDWEEDIMQLDKEKGEYLSFPAYFNDGNLEINESPITYITFDGASILTFGIYGYSFMEEANGEVPVIFDDYKMAVAEPIQDGQTTTQLIGQHGEYKDSQQSIEWDYCKMGYIAWNPNTGAYQTLNPPLRFPITITHVSNEYDPNDPIQVQNAGKAEKALFNAEPISTDFLKKDFSKFEKNKPLVYKRID